MSEIADRGYANPDVLVSTDWVAEHLDDPNVRMVESNEDPLVYRAGHIPGAVEVDWTRDLNDQLRRDYLDRAGFERLARRIGISPETTVVFYGDKNNWWACYAYWVFQLFGHTEARVMDGGRLKWQKEGRELVRDEPSYDATESASEIQAASGFDANAHPVIRFVTDNQFELAKDWIQLNGTMTIQGVSQKVRLRATPIYDSPGCRKRMVKVIVDGEVDLNRFGVAGGEEMDQHPMLLNLVLKNDGC